jgi:hypothetical protein
VDRAQEALCSYLTEKELNPTVVIHRGHSYYAPYTIEQLASSAKIVFLGSCGGYHLIHDVLARASDAHIIASKQIGKQVINQPLIDMMMENLRVGKNIEWIPFWRDFESATKTLKVLATIFRRIKIWVPFLSKPIRMRWAVKTEK